MFGLERIQALPSGLCSDAALMQWVGFNGPQVRDGLCQRGTATRQGERHPGPLGPDTWAQNIVKLNLRDLEGMGNGAIRAVAKAGIFGKPVTGSADGTALETTERDPGWGQVTRKRRIEDKRGHVQEIEGTGYGWKGLWLSDARTKIPLAVKVGPIDAHETHGTRALVTHARAHVAGCARVRQVVFDQGFLEGTALWWLDQHDMLCVVPAKATMAVTTDAHAQAAAGEGLSVARRVHTVRHGQGKGARTERLETEVVGITGLTPYEQHGTPEHGRHPHRRDVQGHPMNAVVVRQWNGRDPGPGGKTVFVTNASVDTPLQPFDDDADRRLIEHGCIKACTQPWDWGHPPQKTERGGRVPVLFTLRMFALATAYRLPCAQEARGADAVGWQRWRRPLREQTRDLVSVFAQGFYGLVPLAEDSLLMGVQITDVPSGLGTPQAILAPYRRSPKA